MKIAIEAQRIFRTKKHGMDFVVLETLRELQKIDKENDYYVFVGPGEDRCLSETKNFHIVDINSSFYPLWEQWLLPRRLKKIKPDVLHCTSNTAPVCIGKTLLIVTIHDVIYLEKQTNKNRSWYQNFGRIYRRLVVPRIASKSKMIVTVSDFEKDRIAQVFPLMKDSIRFVYNGYGSHFKVMGDYTDVVKKYTTSNDYLFFLGNTDPKKNVQTTLKAYSIYLNQSEKKRKLLIADLDSKEFNRILEEESLESIREYVELIGYVSNADLPAIYNGAYMFLYTSKRESFGIPILESMACGTPIITGQVSAMPEIAGNCGTLVDAFCAEDIAQMMLKLEIDTEFYAKAVEYGLARSKKFSWNQAAESILKLYKSI